MPESTGSNPFDPNVVPPRPGQQPRPAALPGMSWPSANERIAPAATPAAAVPAAPVAPGTDKKPPEPKDTFREIVETVVFVVVLVLLLKAFMAEAFVIPTGSMATTLLGYHREIKCPECGFKFPLNMSKQMDPQETTRQNVTGCTCPNCQLHINASNSEQFSGQ